MQPARGAAAAAACARGALCSFGSLRLFARSFYYYFLRQISLRHAPTLMESMQAKIAAQTQWVPCQGFCRPLVRGSTTGTSLLKGHIFALLVAMMNNTFSDVWYSRILERVKWAKHIDQCIRYNAVPRHPVMSAHCSKSSNTTSANSSKLPQRQIPLRL